MSSKLMPWACWGEWADVAGCLSSTHSQGATPAGVRELQALGVDMVAAWRTRGRVPLAADITAALVEARLQDQQLLGHQSSMQQPFHEAASDHALRLAYALPIVRLVNGIADSQQRGRVAASVAVLSRTAGLPHLLVDIRHDATHGELPSLVMLRLGCRQALDWLQANYWDAQAQQLQACYTRINHILASLLASCTAAAIKVACHDAGNGAGGFCGSSSEEEDEPSSFGQGAVGLDVGLPWLPGLEKLLPGLHMVQGSNLQNFKDGCSYSAARGRKQRKELLSQLKGLVPQAWAHVLVGPLLDCSTLTPPLALHSAAAWAASALEASCTLPGYRSMQPSSCSAEQAEEGRAWVKRFGGGGSEDVLAVLEGRSKLAAWDAQQTGSTCPVQTDGGNDEALAAAMAVAQKAWLTCMSLVLKAYPALGSMLLYGCVQRLRRAQALPAAPDALYPHIGGHPSEGPRSQVGVNGHSSSRCDTWWGALGLLNAAPLLPRGSGGEGGGSDHGFHPSSTAVGRLLVLYGWTIQLLGPAAHLEPSSMRSGEQTKGMAKQQQGAAASIVGPHLPSLFHFSLLSLHQLIQLLSDLLQDSHSFSIEEGGTDKGCREPGSSAVLQECKRRLAGRLASDLGQHILQAEVQAGQSMQGHEGWKGSSCVEGVVERGAGGGVCTCLMPDWLRKAHELVELAHRLPQQGVLAPAAASLHLRGRAAQPLMHFLPQEQTHHQAGQPHYAGILRPPSPPPASDGMPATKDTTLAAAEARQAELLRRMRSAQGGHNILGAAAATVRPAAVLAQSMMKDGVLAEPGPGAHVNWIPAASLQRQGCILSECTDAHAGISNKRPREGGEGGGAGAADFDGSEWAGRAQEGEAWNGPTQRKRWREAAHWQPCAIGCLPHALQMGGRLPCLARQLPFGAACMPAGYGDAGAREEEQQQQQQQPVASPHEQVQQQQQQQQQQEDWGKMGAHYSSLNGCGQATCVEKARQAPSMECKQGKEEQEGVQEGEDKDDKHESRGEDGHWQNNPGTWQHVHTQGLLLQAQATVSYL